MIDMLERKAKNPENIVKYARLIAEREHPDWTEEQIESAAKDQKYIDGAIFQLTYSDFRRWIYHVYYNENVDYEDCTSEALYLLKNVPKELIQNINEWMDDLPLSDIKIHGVSVNDVLKMFAPRVSFVQVLRCMIAWKECDFFDKDFCWKFFALM